MQWARLDLQLRLLRQRLVELGIGMVASHELRFHVRRDDQVLIEGIDIIREVGVGWRHLVSEHIDEFSHLLSPRRPVLAHGSRRHSERVLCQRVKRCGKYPL